MRLSLIVALLIAACAAAQDANAPKGPADWKVEVVAKTPQVNYCSVVCCAPDGRVFLAEDPMDMVGPPNRPIDRILCLHPDGRITTFAENLYAVFGLVYMDGKLYVHHCPKFSVFDDGGDVGKNRVDLIESTHPQPWGGMNDHIPANVRLGMDGWFYMSVGDKGIFGAVGKDGSKAEIIGGGILRFRPDATKLEVYSSGTRNHLDMALNAEDEMFTYDNTDDGLGWWTKVTHMVDGGFYGYPHDYKPRRPYTLWAMADYGGGSPTGGLAYNEDALPPEYHGNLFMCEWGKGQLARFVVERDKGSFKIKSREAFLQKGKEEFRPVGVAVSPDGMSLYLADWNFSGWSNRTAKAGRLIKATYQGKSQAAPKPQWYLPAALGKPFTASLDELVQGLSHPAQSVRFVAMRRVAERGAEARPALEKLVRDTKAAPVARWSAIWTLDLIGDGRGGRDSIVAVLGDADASVRRQAARQLGGRQAPEAVLPLVKMLSDDDRSVRFQAATALGRIGDPAAVAGLLGELVDDDLFARYAAFTALHRIGRAQPTAWPAIAAGLTSDKTPVREGTLFAFRDAYDPAAVATLAHSAENAAVAADVRGEALALLGDLSRQRPAWKGQWWGTRPAAGKPPTRTVDWSGTKTALGALQKGLEDAEPIVRQGAARGMLAATDAALAVSLARHIPQEKDNSTKIAILRLLTNGRGADAAYVKAANAILVPLLASDDPELFGEAINLAAALPSTTPEVTEVALKRLEAKLTPAMQIGLLDAVAKANDAKSVAAIAARARMGEAGVSNHAIKLLASIKGDEASRALLDALKSPAPALRKDAAAALGKRKETAAVPMLVALASDPEAGFEAVSALAQMPDVRAVALYVNHLDSKNQPLRTACLNAVKALRAEALPLIEARIAKTPVLPAETILTLQKFYADDAAVRSSPLFRVAPKSISIADFTSASLKENGDRERGRKLFMDLKGASCVKCHKVGDEGSDVGPDLRGIGAKYSRQQLAESILEPSKLILDGYIMSIVETKAGQVIQGIVRSSVGDEVTLVDAEGKKIVLKKGEIESLEKSKKSIMPDGLHVGMTIGEFADLLSYLENMKEKAPPAAPKSSRLIEERGPAIGADAARVIVEAAVHVRRLSSADRP
ncbi:MAG: HEAT repeat domain-containing protein [Planctomycetota bacterium]